VLPIAHRELRIACRKRGTFWVRIITALIGLVIGGFCFLLATAGAAPVPGIGKALFVILTWISLAVALAAGLFVTSDCISEEKREGTLGLLFLTDLRGYDVVAGKFFATSLRSLYGMIALFPVLGVTLLMGGVSGTQFWKTALALTNALFFSLAIGLFVSSIGRDWQKVMSGTLALLLLFAFGGPIFDFVLGKLQGNSTGPWASLASPFFVFLQASAWIRSPFWSGILVTQLIAWFCLGLACFAVPRSWQERAKKNSNSSASFSYAWTYGNADQRTRLRQRLIDQNPVFWLSCRQRRQAWGAWIMSFIFGFLFLLPLLLGWPRASYSVWSFGAKCLILLLYLWMASQAGRFFVQARRNGLIELLVVGPLSTRQIVHGQWRGLLRMFAVPVCLIVLLDFAATMFSEGVWGRAAFYQQADVWMIASFAAASSGIAVLGNMAALAWFGMWMGLTSKSVNFATFKTLLFVQVIPWFVIMFGSLFFFAALNAYSYAAKSPWAHWWPYLTGLLTATLTLLKDFAFIGWTRQLLYTSFREQAARNWAQPRFPAATPVPISIPAPPVMHLPVSQ